MTAPPRDGPGRVAVVAGGSGLVGGHLLEDLLSSGAYTRVVSLVRRPSGRAHPKLEERSVDFEQVDATPVPPGADVFVTLGTTIAKAGSREAFRRVDHDYVVGVGRAAKAGRAARLLAVSALGADPSSRVFYSRVKGEAEEALAALGLPALFLFRPSFLDGARAESRPGEAAGIAFVRAVRFALVGPLRKYRAVEARAVARAMLASALSPATGRVVVESDRIGEVAATLQ